MKEINWKKFKTEFDATLSPTLSKMFVLTGMFWSSNAILQRITGLMRIHTGRAYPLTVLWGCTCTSISMIATHYNADGILNHLSENMPKLLSTSQSNQWFPKIWTSNNNINTAKDDSKKFMMTFIIYSIIERRFFRSFIPSSLLDTGAYKQTLAHITSKNIKATSAIATPNQRYAMQRLGIVHGCHHCGSRQLIGSNSFIADHMPPTKHILIDNNKWYRKKIPFKYIFHELKQNLLPQCQKCFSLQGNAVKNNIHYIIYHSPIRAWHFAPAITYACIDKKLLNDTFIMNILDDISNNYYVYSIFNQLQTVMKVVK
jgi:hypothetical protein